MPVETKRFIDDPSQYAIDDPEFLEKMNDWELDDDLIQLMKEVDDNLRYAAIRCRDIIVG